LWAWLLEVMRQSLEFFFNLTGSNGLAIILMTVVIRIILLPLTFSQTRSMQKIQELQPELKNIQQKYKNDPQRANRETVELWKKHKVNPMAGCLPLLLQFPILIALYQVLRVFEYPGSPRFLWIPDLAAPDKVVLPILAAVTTYWQTKITTTGNDPSQKSMLIFMPLLVGWFAMSFPAGLSLYWVVSNLFGIAQQYAMPKGLLRKGEASS